MEPLNTWEWLSVAWFGFSLLLLAWWAFWLRPRAKRPTDSAAPQRR